MYHRVTLGYNRHFQLLGVAVAIIGGGAMGPTYPGPLNVTIIAVPQMGYFLLPEGREGEPLGEDEGEEGEKP